MKLSETGEFGLISLLREAMERSRDPSLPSWQGLVLGAGDDCAAWRGDPSIELATTDTLVQGVHFLKGTFKWPDLGHRSMASNLSDVAAMGGHPLYALVSLSLPGATRVEDVLGLFQGMLDEATRHSVAIVGGNVSGGPVLAITVALFGRLAGEAMLLRSAAKPGDQIAVTGYLGASSAGVATMRRKLRVDRATKAFLCQAHFGPEPRIAEGQALVGLGVRAAIDISDGLVSDLTRICEESKVGARVYAERVPVSPRLREAIGREALDYALEGGEDFELLFTAPPQTMELACSTLSTPVTVIGDIVSDHLGAVSLSGPRWKRDLEGKGWDHFKR